MVLEKEWYATPHSNNKRVWKTELYRMGKHSATIYQNTRWVIELLYKVCVCN